MSSKNNFFNKKNNYAIRKFTVGTASIIIGTTFFLGINSNAQASEVKEEITMNAPSSIEIDESEKQDTSEQQTVDQTNEVETQSIDDSVETTTESPKTEGASSEAEVVTQKEAIQQEQSLEQAEPSLETNEAPLQDKTIEDVSSETATSKNETSQNIESKAITSNQPEIQNDVEAEIEKVQPQSSTQPDKEQTIDNTNVETRTEASTEVTSERQQTTDPVKKNTTPSTSQKATEFQDRIDRFVKDNHLTAQNKNAIIEQLPQDAATMSEQDLNIALSNIYFDLQNQQQNRATLSRSAFRSIQPVALNGSTTDLTNIAQGAGSFTDYGDIVHQHYEGDFPDKGILTAFNTRNDPQQGTSGALQFNEALSFNKDFEITVPIANLHQGNSTNADGWGFIFTKKNGSDFLQEGGILRDKGIADSAGFKIDTSYNNYRGVTDPIDANKNNFNGNIGGASFQGYGAFVKNNATGVSEQVGSNALNSTDKPINKIIYADNSLNVDDGKFHGQRFNDVVLSYDANTGKVTASYAGKTWEATTEQLGINKNDQYNFLITSSQMVDRFTNGIMRTDLNGVSIKVPNEDVTPIEGNPEVTKEEIPFEVERQFNPDLAPGEEKVVQEGEPGEQTTT
ncbi:lectin-like domain-containing protein, partial [Staphylococcus canis]